MLGESYTLQRLCACHNWREISKNSVHSTSCAYCIQGIPLKAVYHVNWPLRGWFCPPGLTIWTNKTFSSKKSSLKSFVCVWKAVALLLKVLMKSLLFLNGVFQYYSFFTWLKVIQCFKGPWVIGVRVIGFLWWCWWDRFRCRRKAVWRPGFFFITILLIMMVLYRSTLSSWTTRGFWHPVEQI